MDGLFEARAQLQATLKAGETAFEARRKISAETKLVPLEGDLPPPSVHDASGEGENLFVAAADLCSMKSTPHSSTATTPRTEAPWASLLGHSPPDLFSPLEGTISKQIETNIQEELKGLGMNLSRLREQVDMYKEGRHLQSDQELHTEKSYKSGYVTYCYWCVFIFHYIFKPIGSRAPWLWQRALYRHHPLVLITAVLYKLRAVLTI